MSKQKLHQTILDNAKNGNLQFKQVEDSDFILVAYTSSDHTITVYVDEEYYTVDDNLYIKDNFDILMENIKIGTENKDEEVAKEILKTFRI